MRNISDIFAEKIKTVTPPHPTPPPEYRAVYEIMWKKCGTARQATDHNVVRRVRFACRITKATNAHSEYLITVFFHYNNSCTNAPQCFVIRTLTVLFNSDVCRKLGVEANICNVKWEPERTQLDRMLIL